MQFTKTVVALTVACASATAAQSCSPNNPTTTPCPLDFTCQALLGSMKGEGTCVANAAPPAPQKCNPNNPTTTPCPPDFTCQALLGNANGEGTCVAAAKCWMNMGQFGCKENDGKTSADDGCFATKHECNAKYSTGRKLRKEGEVCNPNKLFSCGLLFKCEAMLGNTKHKGKCVRRQLPLPTPASGKCNPERPNSCGHGKTCQALLGNVNGEGTCVAASKCWMNMGQFGCKTNDGKTSADDGCFATKHECNAKYSVGKCWMNMGQFGCKENDGKTSADDGCFATKHECNAKYSGGKHLRG